MAHGNPDGGFQHGKALHDRGLAIARQFIYCDINRHAGIGCPAYPQMNRR